MADEARSPQPSGVGRFTELRQVVLVGGCPKGHEEPFDPSTLSGKRLRALLAKTGLQDAKLIDLWKTEEEELKGTIDQTIISQIDQWIKQGVLVWSLGRWVQSRLAASGIITGYLPHPASRRPQDLLGLERGLRRLARQRWPKLGRIWFTRQMREAILAGRKTATTRDHQKGLGDWLAVGGSYFSADPFAVITITENSESTWEHSLENFRAEGFESLEGMHRFAYETGLDRYAKAPHLYFHRFEVVLTANGAERP